MNKVSGICAEGCRLRGSGGGEGGSETFTTRKKKYGARTHVKVVLGRIIEDLEERSSIVVVMERNMEVGAGP